MEPETLYRWILNYGHYVAQICLLITAALMVKSRKGIGEITALAGFTAFLMGSLMMHDTGGVLVQIGQFSIGSRADRQMWQVGQTLAAGGFLVGALALMLNKLFRR